MMEKFDNSFFLAALEEIRNNYNQSPRKSIAVVRPNWIERTSLVQLYASIPNLTRNGKIVFGCFIMANEYIFQKRGAGNAMPGLIIYSNDVYYEENMLELAELASHILTYKNNGDVNNELSEQLDNETDYSYGFKIPSELTPNGEVYMSTIMLFRKHLTDNMLKGRVVPIFIDSISLNFSMIVPKEYWGKIYAEYNEYHGSLLKFAKRKGFLRLSPEENNKRNIRRVITIGIPLFIVPALAAAVIGIIGLTKYGTYMPDSLKQIIRILFIVSAIIAAIVIFIRVHFERKK